MVVTLWEKGCGAMVAAAVSDRGLRILVTCLGAWVMKRMVVVADGEPVI